MKILSLLIIAHLVSPKIFAQSNSTRPTVSARVEHNFNEGVSLTPLEVSGLQGVWAGRCYDPRDSTISAWSSLTLSSYQLANEDGPLGGKTTVPLAWALIAKPTAIGFRDLDRGLKTSGQDTFEKNTLKFSVAHLQGLTLSETLGTVDTSAFGLVSKPEDNLLRSTVALHRPDGQSFVLTQDFRRHDSEIYVRYAVESSSENAALSEQLGEPLTAGQALYCYYFAKAYGAP